MWKSVFAASLLSAPFGMADAGLAAPLPATGHPVGLVRFSPAHRGIASIARTDLVYALPAVQAHHSARSLSRKKAPAKPKKRKK